MAMMDADGIAAFSGGLTVQIETLGLALAATRLLSNKPGEL